MIICQILVMFTACLFLIGRNISRRSILWCLFILPTQATSAYPQGDTEALLPTFYPLLLLGYIKYLIEFAFGLHFIAPI